MDPKLTTIDTRPELKPTSETKPPAPRPKGPLRRQVDLGLVTGPGPGYLLSHEDPNALQTLRLSVQDKLGAQAPIELAVAEFATAAARHGLRALRHLGASVDAEVHDQIEAVNREYHDIDSFSRTALIYHDPGLARVLRGFERTFNESHRAIRQIFPMKAAKTRT